MESLIKSLTKNQVDDLANVLVENLRYCDPSIEYPDVESAKPDDGVIAEWFYPIYAGTNDFSELSAILTYTTQESKFEEAGELLLGIGLTEMKHYGKLSEFIRALGGTIKPRYNSSVIKVGSTVLEALQISLAGENKTIKFYEDVAQKILQEDETETTVIAIQFINKLIADEKVHKYLLEAKIKELTPEQKVEEQAEGIGHEEGRMGIHI